MCQLSLILISLIFALHWRCLVQLIAVRRVLCFFPSLSLSPSKSIFISSWKYHVTLIWWDSKEAKRAKKRKAARAKVWWWLLTNYLLAWELRMERKGRRREWEWVVIERKEGTRRRWRRKINKFLVINLIIFLGGEIKNLLMNHPEQLICVHISSEEFYFKECAFNVESSLFLYLRGKLKEFLWFPTYRQTHCIRFDVEITEMLFIQFFPCHQEPPPPLLASMKCTFSILIISLSASFQMQSFTNKTCQS